MGGHELLPARTPSGVKVEELIKKVYELEQAENYSELSWAWGQIELIAEFQAERAALKIKK